MNDRSTPSPGGSPEAQYVGPLNKGLGELSTPTALSDIPRLGWSLLAEDLSLPTAVLSQRKLLHNRDWMQRFIEAYGVRLAPHGKTTMAPALFRLQLAGGAWGITLATAQQCAVAHAFGVPRVLMANQLVGKGNMAIISRLLADPSFDFFCLVDSAEQVHQLGRFFAARQQRLQVLVELGVTTGRAGIRNDEQLAELLEALARWRPHLALCGVELYEGVLKEEPEIRSFLQRALQVTQDLATSGRFDREPAILSGAGSAWYDIVAEELAHAALHVPTEVVLRPGCYLTHDVGVYRAAQQRIDSQNPIARHMASTLQPALQLWAYIQSIPEPSLAIVTLGKRDAAFDSGLPTPALHFRPGSEAPASTPVSWKLTKMMDQHAYLEIVPGDDLRVGDMVGFDISHPCLTFDKWRYLPVLDENYKVVDLVETFF